MCKKLFHSILFIAALVAAMSFTVPGTGKLTVEFKNYVGSEPLIVDSVAYKNSLQQSYTVSMFKYYVGNFHLTNIRGQQFVSKGYFLINQDDKNSMQISIDSIPQGEYTAIGFALGVDSIDNCSGAQSGVLDPINGMFWSWNSGYIFLKMEGISPVSNNTGKRLEYHIGGYKEPNNCIKLINIKLKQPLEISEGRSNMLMVKTDMSHLFTAPNPVDFSKLSSVTDYRNAKEIADNYSTMFSIIVSGK